MEILGFNVIESPNMTLTKFTKKQTRKFRNRRWVKKYLKKYSYQIPSEDILISEQLKTVYCHPSAFQLVRQELEKQIRESQQVPVGNIALRSNIPPLRGFFGGVFSPVY